MKRESCNRCDRPLISCYCSAIVAIKAPIKVLILQHRLESSHPFNTGKMAQLSLTNCQLVIENEVSVQTQHSLLNNHSVLLYPNLTWLPETPIITNKHDLSHYQKEHGNIKQLVVLDGNWRKSKRMLHQNACLQNLTRLSFSHNLVSNYQIRRSKMENSLSTIESIALALLLFSPNFSAESLLAPFNFMVEQQKALQRFNR
ncbi:tRNA-uridine aminocarboxypropyltransferase [Aliikangiella sp. IMCC44632]